MCELLLPNEEIIMCHTMNTVISKKDTSLVLSKFNLVNEIYFFKSRNTKIPSELIRKLIKVLV